MISRTRPAVTSGKPPGDRSSRIVLNHITSRWGVPIFLALESGTLRFGELRREIAGISEKMLAQTLRTFETDGIVLREAQSTIPPRVDYSLTERGHAIAMRLSPLMDWIVENADAIVNERVVGEEHIDNAGS